MFNIHCQTDDGGGKLNTETFLKVTNYPDNKRVVQVCCQTRAGGHIHYFHREQQTLVRRELKLGGS